MSELIQSRGNYGMGPYWVRWSAFHGDDIQTVRAKRPEELIETYDRWLASTDGRVTASPGVTSLIQARQSA